MIFNRLIHKYITLVSIAFAVGASVMAFGGVRSTFYPISSNAYKARLPSGEECLFLREDEHSIFGESQLIGEIDGRKTLIRTVPGAPGDERGFLFFDGRLRRVLKNGVESAVSPLEGVEPFDSPSALWAKKNQILTCGKPPDIWRESTRLRLWFTNPNDAGLLFSIMAAMFFAICINLKKPCVATIVGSVLLTAIFIGGVVLSGSRGAFVAMLVACALTALTRMKGLRKHRGAIILGIVVVAIVALSTRSLNGRFTSKLFAVNGDNSNSIRVSVLKAAPEMFAASPSGWGFGNSGRAYVDWYQDSSSFVCDNLISSHLTMIVEGGWAFSWIYATVWMLVILVAFVVAVRGGSPVALATFSALGVGGCFNPALFQWTLYILPVLMMCSIWRDIAAFGWRTLARYAIGCSIFSLIGLISFAMLGVSQANQLKIVKNGNVVEIGSGTNVVHLVDDDYAMNGGFWWSEGKDIRKWMGEHTDAKLCLVRNIDDLPDDADRIVVVGEQCSRLLDVWRAHPWRDKKRVLFLSPSCRLSEVPADFVEVNSVSGYRGEFLACLDGSDVQPWMTIVRGAEIYLPKWLDYSFKF